MSATRSVERSEARTAAHAGVWCPVMTPVDDELQPDVARFVAHARWLLDHGCHGLVLFGTTGEANSFSVDERMALTEGAIEAGLPRDKILIGTGCCALTDSVRLTRHALDLGVAGVLMLPPFYYKGIPDEGLFASFDQVIQRVGRQDFRLYLYHFPKLSGVPITPGLIELLLGAYPHTVAGVKDSSGDWENTKLLIERFPEIAIFPGAETFLLPGLEIGGTGCITASANVNVEPIRAVYDAFMAGDEMVKIKQQDITRTRMVLQARPLIPAMKYLLADARHDDGWRRVRPPFLALAETEGEALKRELAAQGFGLDAA